MKHLSKFFIFALISAMSLSTHAGGNPEAGKAIASEKCQACHGVDGNSSDPQYPRLAGQYADYLEHTLAGYKDGSRANPIMAGFAAGLSEQDIKDVASWFASQSGVVTPRSAATASK